MTCSRREKTYVIIYNRLLYHAVRYLLQLPIHGPFHCLPVAATVFWCTTLHPNLISHCSAHGEHV